MKYEVKLQKTTQEIVKIVVDADSKDQAEELALEEDGPQEDDYVTKDYVEFYQYGKLVLVVRAGLREYACNNWTKEVKDHMNREKFWPNVWFERERGGYDLLSLETGTFTEYSKEPPQCPNCRNGSDDCHHGQ